MLKKLLLSAGGGIIDTQDQIPRAEVATVDIGLGGTGIDCLCELKKSVYTKLVPDVVDTVVLSISTSSFLLLTPMKPLSVTEVSSTASTGILNIRLTSESFRI